jgi:hypothetical protein
MSLIRIATICLLAPILLLAIGAPAHAYIDAGSSSYLFQLAIGAFVAASFGLRMFWGRIKEITSRLLRRN